MPMQCSFAVALLFALALGGAAAAERPEGFVDHGVAAPVGQASWGGGIAAADAEGRRIVVFKLWTRIGERPGRAMAYVLIDAETGEAEQLDAFHGRNGFSMFLSPDNRLYDTVGNRLAELDIETRQLRFVGEVPPQMAMSFTMDDDGVIYAGLYPNAELISYNPRTQALTNHGPLAEEDWPQYPALAADDAGWIYSTIRHQRGNLLAFHPATGERRALLDDAERAYVNRPTIFRAQDGRAYARLDHDNQWRKLHSGRAELVDAPGASRAVFRSTAGRRPTEFPDGSRFVRLDVPNRRLLVQDAGADAPREVAFDYRSDGVAIYSLAVCPQGRVHGSTGIPLRWFVFDPATGETENWGMGTHGGHVNAMARQGGRVYGMVYSSGSLVELDPEQPFDDSPLGRSRNPVQVYGPREARNLFGRPFALLAHPDGRHLVAAGNPARGLTGGGMLIYDRETREARTLAHGQLVEHQATKCLAALPNGDLIGGTTTAAATGGTRIATEAVLYRLDWGTKQVAYTAKPVPGAREIRDIVLGPDGLIYGLANRQRFFVFDPESGETVHAETLEDYGRDTGSQASRVLALGPDGAIYALFREAIARIQPGTFAHEEADRPGVPITAGVAVLDGRLYFASDSRLWSFALPDAADGG